MADASLTVTADTRSAHERYQVVVHVEPTEGSSVLEDGPALAPQTAERLGCDASLVEMVERDGVPLSVGRRTRTIPPAMRRALQARDRRCRFPGCENRRFLHAHHIQHWARGGETKLDNLALLCSRHHRFVHEAGYSIRECGDGKLEFRDPWGGLIPNAPRPPPGNPRLLVEGNRDLLIDSGRCAPGDGERMDLGYAIDALLSLAA
jgi:5-methylcytosine-specific restriction endonuclease McrA